jgi:hypothetical protein
MVGKRNRNATAGMDSFVCTVADGGRRIITHGHVFLQVKYGSQVSDVKPEATKSCQALDPHCDGIEYGAAHAHANRSRTMMRDQSRAHRPVNMHDFTYAGGAHFPPEVKTNHGNQAAAQTTLKCRGVF